MIMHNLPFYRVNKTSNNITTNITTTPTPTENPFTNLVQLWTKSYATYFGETNHSANVATTSHSARIGCKTIKENLHPELSSIKIFLIALGIALIGTLSLSTYMYHRYQKMRNQIDQHNTLLNHEILNVSDDEIDNDSNHSRASTSSMNSII